MKIYLFILAILSLISFEKSLPIAEKETTLVLVQVMLRHGARTVLSRYPNDINQDYWDKYVMGDIVPKGMKQVQDAADYFSKKYGLFLGTSYNSSRVFARSTDYGRTMITTSIFVSSLFRPSVDQRWTNTSGLSAWMPIPVHTNNLSTDTILHLEYICPRRSQLLSLTKLTPDYLKVQTENKVFFQNMSNLSGLKLDFSSIIRLEDKYLVQSFIGLTTEQYILDNLDQILYLGNHYYDFIFNFEYAKLASGGLLKDAVNNMKNKIDGSSYQLFVYGIHDTMIVAIQKLLNMTTKFAQPEFVSAFIVELRMDAEGSYYVQVLFKNNKASEPIELEPLNIYGCDTLCPYEKFVSLVKDTFVNDIETECQNHSS